MSSRLLNYNYCYILRFKFKYYGRGRFYYYYRMCQTWKGCVRPLKRVPRVSLFVFLTKEPVYTCFGTSAILIDLRRVLIDG